MNTTRRIALATVIATLTMGTAAAATPIDAQWSTPQFVSQSGVNAIRPQITMSADGNRLTSVWTQGSPAEIYAAGSDDAGATWSTPTRLSLAGVATDYPQLTASDDGLKVQAVWYAFTPDRVSTASSNDGGVTWGTPVTRLIGQATSNPQIAGSADGTRLTAVWAYDDPNRIVQTTSSTDSGLNWSTPVDLSDDTKDADTPLLATSADGTAVAAVYNLVDGSDQRVFVRTSTDAGANWGSASAISETGQDASPSQALMSADGSRIHVLWIRSDGTNSRVQAARSINGGASWQATTTLSTEGQDASTASMAASADGLTVAAAWQRSDGANARIQTTSSADGGQTWSTPKTQSQAGTDSDNARIAASADGREVTAFWYRNDPGNPVVETTSSVDGAQTWSSVTTVSDPAQPAADPSVAVSSAGREQFAAWGGSDGVDNRIWASAGDVYAAPAAPSGAASTAGNAEVTASWTPPADDGGKAVSSYTATASPGGRTCVTAGTSCVVTGLTNGTTYTVSVTATNAVGTGPASGPSNPVTPAAPPLPPGPEPTPEPSPQPDSPSTTVIAKSTNGASRLKVKVKPDLGSKKQWDFVVKIKKKGDWKTLKTKKDKTKVYTTEGKEHTLKINLDKGTYKAKSKSARGYGADTSDVVKLKK